MLDREKVIKAAEICLRYIDDGDCPTECPYFDLCTQYEKRVVFQPLIRDSLALLKEQEAVEPIPSTDDSDLWRCGYCNSQIFRCTHQRFCHECGREAKWE